MLMKSPVADPDVQSRKKFFLPFGPQFLLKIKGAQGPPGPSSESATEVITK